MLLLAYRHGLRVSELVALRWEQVDLQVVSCMCAGGRTGWQQPIPSMALKCGRWWTLARAYPTMPYVFVSERQAPWVTRPVRKIVARAGEAAHLGLPVSTHTLRHATGFKLANDGHDTRIIQHYLGHKNIQHTVGYTVLAAERFQDCGLIETATGPIWAGEEGGWDSTRCWTKSWHSCGSEVGSPTAPSNANSSSTMPSLRT